MFEFTTEMVPKMDMGAKLDVNQTFIWTNRWSKIVGWAPKERLLEKTNGLCLDFFFKLGVTQEVQRVVQ